jgi:hypothetical protein
MCSTKFTNYSQLSFRAQVGSTASEVRFEWITVG